MKRSRLKPGAKSIERGSTFNADPKPLVRHPVVSRAKHRSFAPASPAQRAKVADAPSRVGGPGRCDPAHVTDRAQGGCDDPLCVVPLTRDEHRAYDTGELDLLPHLTLAEQAHAVGHLGIMGAMRRITNSRGGAHDG